MDTTRSSNRGGLITIGIILVIAGLFLIWGRAFTSFLTVYLLGITLAVVGIVEIIQAFFRGSIGGFFLTLFLGLLTLIIGGFIVLNPSASLLTLTWFFATFLFIVGLFQFFYGLFARPFQWGTFLVGIFNVLLAVLVYNHWPVSGLTAFGWLLGLSFIANGLSSLVLGFSTTEETEVVKPSADGVVTYSSQIKKPQDRERNY